ncbi:S8 family serine peptidase [Maribellus sediminis]|uniref:S8 family serine peptidase n=1 Tax=Maribellus sediminis TaxID=2696285 RepID=UPI00142F4E35|nr:S8 family serine peptidase [Maribellus sediminis]
MKNLLLKLFAFALVIILANACNDPIVNDDDAINEELLLKSANTNKQSYIVVLQDADLDVELTKLKGYEKKQAAVKSASAKILKRAGVLDSELGYVYGSVLQGFSVKMPPGQLKKLQDDPSVKYVEEDGIIALAPSVSINASSSGPQETPWGIARVHGAANYTGSNKAWIVDSGIDMDHPDLNVNTIMSKSFVSGDSSPEDAHGHGTHVAGTVAAKNNTFGVIGVAPGAQVVSCRVLGADGTGSFSWTIAALDYIGTQGVGSVGDVVNMSLGPQTRYTSTTVDNAVIGVANKGIKIAIAAGNSADDATYYSPARVEHANVYTVAAMSNGDYWSSYSNFGSPVDYIEPGSSVTSTYIGGYATMSGTSMASPHMAGILLLGDFATDGTVSTRKRGRTYEYPIAIAGDGGGVNPTPNTAPTAGFSYSVSGLTASFTDKSTDSDGTVDSWSWDFGDGNTSTTASPSHTYASAGTYDVTLTITDNDGDTDSSIQSVTVSENTAGGEIVLDGTITGNKVLKTTLTWTGASGATVTLYLNGTPTVISNSGSYVDNLGKITGGNFVYYIVDEANITSNELDLSF